MKKINFWFNGIKIFMKNQIQDKSNLILDVINMISRCLVVFLLYKYIFKLNGGIINGVDYKTTIWSMFMYFCIMTLNVRRIYRLIMDDVKSGNVEMFLNKPTSYLTFNILKIIGKGLYSFILISFIGSILMILFVGGPNVDLIIFVPTLFLTFIFGQILGVIIYSIIGILSFFILDVRPIYWIIDKSVMLLGGSYLPISMFPKFLKTIAFYSPFGAINFASSTVYDSWNSLFLIRLLTQLVWICILGIILKYVYDKSKEKAMINGG